MIAWAVLTLAVFLLVLLGCLLAPYIEQERWQRRRRRRGGFMR